MPAHVPVNRMMHFKNLTLRNALIAVHDALATAAALFASFYLRFDGDRICQVREYNDTNHVREVFMS